MATMTSTFRVLKGTKFLFEGRLVQKEEAPAQLRRLGVRADEMDLLVGVEITITKRLSLAEVDRMISCCRQHPPQCVITPKDPTNADQLAAFKDLALYLTQRERAGVGTLSSGLLALVTPIADTYDYMRCLIVNATATVGDIGAELPRAITIQPPSDPQTAPKERKKQKTSHRRDEQPQAMTDNQAKERPDTADVSHVVQEEPSQQVQTHQAVLLDASPLSPRTRDAKYAQMREDHASFNAFYHHVLLEWSTKPCDTDSARELARHT